MNQLRTAGYGLGYSVLLGQYADGLLHFGEIDEASVVLDEAMNHLESVPDEIWAPEIHRMRAEVARRTERPFEEVETHYRTAIDVANAQQSRAFQLRSAVALAELMRRTDHKSGSSELLRKTISKMPSRSDLPDLARARELMDSSVDA